LAQAALSAASNWDCSVVAASAAAALPTRTRRSAAQRSTARTCEGFMRVE
jgi:hypothetical protein